MNETTSKTKRLQYVDIARGIAMICIILGHLGNPSINRVVFTFHVPIFFFITGYFTNNKRRLPEFAKNKLRTLIVPYIIACLAIIILGTLLGAHHGDAAAHSKVGCPLLFMAQAAHIPFRSLLKESAQSGFCGQLFGEASFSEFLLISTNIPELPQSSDYSG